MVLKKHLITLLNVVLFAIAWAPSSAQVDEIKVAVLARASKENIKLRWSPTKPLQWQQGNKNGYHINRTILSRNGTLLKNQIEERLTTSPIMPKPLSDWEELAKQNEYAAVMAQAIFGNNFNTTAPGTDTGAIMAINDENEQRFTFALLAAEQSFETAKLGGLAFTDNNVDENETYVYSVILVDPSLPIDQQPKGAVLTGFPYQERLPVPLGFTVVTQDHQIILEWNYGMLKRFYSRYTIEKSEDGNNFKKLEAQPIFNAQALQDEQNVTLVYKDSVPNNKEFYYRIKGMTAFDETGPPSKELSAMAMPTPKFAPIIEKKIFEGENGVRIKWRFNQEEEKSIKGFQLRRANNHNDFFMDVGELLPPKSRETTYAPLQRINYFKVVAIGNNGVERPSFASIVQPVDSIPPQPPVGLNAKIDTTGIVHLSWEENSEEDLLGYRIFRSNNPNVEFSQVTSVELKENNFSDTLNIKNLNRKIYYKVLAEDQRFNASQLSETLEVTLPDLIPPSAPVITSYKITEKGTELKWIPSSSLDVISHSIYRSDMKDGQIIWRKIHETTELDTLFLDKEKLPASIYNYIVVALDYSGLESNPSNPLTVNQIEKPIEKEDLSFTANVNRELRFINLSWKIENKKVTEYKLFKGTSKEELNLYKTIAGTQKGFNDTHLTINTSYTYGLQALLENGQLSPIKVIEVNY
ncbi:fibronectin type III domain-containing protein [Euzebyella saccharophila]|uniref:Fibronectin type 3 domain-containing protein n=1 Tax=Euzebyella saccharophila TaxID=679664 RepID=A0ABV8JUT5_9FLAO|nr:hypothetical protein [Euzebyella saccharophila]